MIKYNLHHVTNGTIKARCHYSLDNRADGRKCVTIYAKDYTDQLHNLFPAQYENKTDIGTDYFEKGLVRLFPDHPEYAAARRAVTLILIRESMAIAQKCVKQALGYHASMSDYRAYRLNDATIRIENALRMEGELA